MKGLSIRLTVIFIIISSLTFVSLVCFAANDEGTQGGGVLGSITFVFSKLFYLLRFPTHTFLFDYLDGYNFIWGLLFNCLFWTIIIHLTIKYLRK